MSSQQLTFNAEAVAATVNQIDVAIADIDTRCKKYISLLEEKNAQTSNKWPMIKTLQATVEKEAQSIQNTIEACEAIKEAIRNYEIMADEASDDTDFRV